MNKPIRPVRDIATAVPPSDPSPPPLPPPTTASNTKLPAVFVIAAFALIALGAASKLNSAWPIGAWLPWLVIAIGILQLFVQQSLRGRNRKIADAARAFAIETHPQLKQSVRVSDDVSSLNALVYELTSALTTAKRAVVVTPIAPRNPQPVTPPPEPNKTISDDETQRIRGALDVTSTNVMIADAEGYIRYVNESVSKMLSAAEADLRRELPEFSVKKLVGTHFDSFHKNPAHQRNLLAKLSGTYQTQISVGPRTFQLIANPVTNPAGQRIGTVVEWRDRTAEVAVEREFGTIVAAAGRGDFSQRLATADKQGFFLQLAEGINALIEISASSLNDIAQMLSALANGDLSLRITADYQGLFERLKNDSNATAAQLNRIVGEILHATEAINGAASEIASGNDDLSARTEAQAASLEETVSAMHQLTTTVKQNAENAAHANQLTADASKIATRGGEVVGKVVETMDSISQSSRKIVDIISVIDGIAFQTNILALNAAVEAARAGEQGRGFAVVASEVRSLSQRSASAAREIKELITDSVGKIEAGAALVGTAGQTMNDILSSIRHVNEIMSQIRSASAEQSAGIEQVNQSITQLDEVTQQNAALVEEASAAAKSLADQSTTLKTSVAIFRIDGGNGNSPAWDGVTERRSPNRAKNVTRIYTHPN